MTDSQPSPNNAPEAFTAEQVQHLAMLARIGMTTQEVEGFRAELDSILSHIQALAAVDTDGVPPTANGADLLNVQAEDAARPSLPVEAVLANAPQREADYFRVQAVLESS